MMRGKLTPVDFQLFAANNTVINTYGSSSRVVDLGLRRPFRWQFIIADVRQPIIGADFLAHHGILPDLKNKRLVDEQTLLSTKAKMTTGKQATIATIDEGCKIKELLRKYVEITRPTALKETVHDVRHHIVTKGPPLAERPRRLPPEKYANAKREFETMLAQGICRPSSSQWASPLHLVSKSNGEWRPCGDFRKLNSTTVADKYPLPHIQDFTYHLAGCTVFSKIDLVKAYFQIPVAEEDRHKTAITTPFGLYEFNRMPFGLRNAAQTFQRFIDTVLRGLKFCHGYVDDLLVASKDDQEHQQHLEEVFKRLKKHGLSINVAKSKFAENEVEYLGYKVTKDGIQPLEKRITAVMNFKKPDNTAELRRYLGMVNFYHRFIENAATVLAPLNKRLANKKKKDKQPINWTTTEEEAFRESKERLAKATLLAHPLENAKLIVKTDASNIAMGAVLEQYQSGDWKPLGFYSKKLSETQQRYSTYDRELLAIYAALKFFRHMVEGRDVTIATDHKPLQYAFQQPLDKASERQRRQLSFISQITTKITYLAGKENTVADALSRIEEINMPVIVTTDELAEEQQKDEELQTLLKSKTSLNLKKLRLDNGDKTVYCDVTDEIRIYVPTSLRRRIFDVTHKASHPSGRTTRKMIARNFVWPNMQKDITYWAKTCLACQRAKIHRHNRRIPEQTPVPDDRFSHIHLDIVGPLPPSKGFRYCLTMIDRTTRWPEATPIADCTADTIVTAFFNAWISRYGAPAVITTDRGAQFESALFDALVKLIGSRRIRTTAYHPQANGMVERWHRSLKSAIKCHGTSDWTEVLPTILLGLRASYKEDIQASAAELVFGTTLKLPGEYFTFEDPIGLPQMFAEKLRKYMRQARGSPTAHHIKTKTFIHKELQDATHVFIRIDRPREPLERPYEGPFKIIERISDFLYRIDYKGQPEDINIDRLKPAFMEKAGENQPLPEDNPLPGPPQAATEKEHLVRRVKFATP
ncbi:unnamed protein product [Lasius platythorax]|uniref:RNA-directed DNA polymerase n=1 Tax=Lasius platythorax TaxID=488582 RepID=A0AAV2NWX9_9HYME